MNRPTARHRPAVSTLITLGLLIWAAPWHGRVALAQNQVLFISVVDEAGEPVTDLQPEDVVVQWDGQESQTLELEPVNLPVRVTVFIDNGESAREALQHMREGLKGFVTALPEDVEMALLTIGRQPRWIARHTTDKAELTSGLDAVVPDNGTSARYLDAWAEAAERLEDDDERAYLPVIVMIAADGPEGSSLTQGRYEEMIRRMLASSATLHTRMYSGTGNVSAPQSQIGIEMSNFTGGSYQALAASNAFLTMLPELGRDIARKHKLTSHQYRVTYAPPAGASEQPAISVGTSRPNLNPIPTMDGNVR